MPSEPLNSVVGLLAVLSVGRLALALLPPGWPGSHRTRELAATAAASFVLGLALLATQATLYTLLGARSDAITLLAPWTIVLVLRLVTLPGAMRPRHEPRAEPTTLAARAMLGVGVAGILRPLLEDPAPAVPEGPLALLTSSLGVGPLLGVLALATVAILVERGLERGRRGPLQRALAFAAVAWLPPLQIEAARGGSALLAAMALTAGGAGAIAWLRRADRRALLVGCTGLGASALLAPAGWSPALGGLVLLVAATAPPSRKRAALGGLSIVTVALLVRGAVSAFALPSLDLFVVLLAPAALLLLAQTVLRREQQPEALA